MMTLRIQTQYLKTFGGERWQTEAAPDLGQIFHCSPFPCVWKASPFNRDDEKSSKPDKTVTITLDSRERKGTVFNKKWSLYMTPWKWHHENIFVVDNFNHRLH